LTQQTRANNLIRTWSGFRCTHHVRVMLRAKCRLLAKYDAEIRQCQAKSAQIGRYNISMLTTLCTSWLKRKALFVDHDHTSS